jgi:N6-adenosine-specific RNA methylase IME4
MTDEEIKNIQVSSAAAAAADNAILFMWATGPKLVEALAILKAW